MKRLALVLLLVIPGWLSAQSPSGFVVTKEPVYNGLRATADLPASQHHRNVGGSDGAGLCVYTSFWHAALWQSVSDVYEFRAYMERRPGGSYPQKFDSTLAAYCKSKSIPLPGYVQHTGGDVEFLRLALKTGRMVCVTYCGVDGAGRYGSEVIGHMVNLVYLDESTACILDNNFPGSFLWMPAKEFVARWTGVSTSGQPYMARDRLGRRFQIGGGWAIVLLDSPPAPYPAKPIAAGGAKCDCCLPTCTCTPGNKNADCVCYPCRCGAKVEAATCTCGDNCKCEAGTCPNKCPVQATMIIPVPIPFTDLAIRTTRPATRKDMERFGDLAGGPYPIRLSDLRPAVEPIAWRPFQRFRSNSCEGGSCAGGQCLDGQCEGGQCVNGQCQVGGNPPGYGDPPAGFEWAYFPALRTYGLRQLPAAQAAPRPAGKFEQAIDPFPGGVVSDKINPEESYSHSGHPSNRAKIFAMLGKSLADDSTRWNLAVVGESPFLARVHGDIGQLPAELREKIHVHTYLPAEWPVSQFNLLPGVTLRKPAVGRIGADSGVIDAGSYNPDRLVSLLNPVLGIVPQPTPPKPDEPKKPDTKPDDKPKDPPKDPPAPPAPDKSGLALAIAALLALLAAIFRR